MQRKPCVIRKQLPVPRGKKEAFMDKLRRYFYLDVSCTLPDENFLSELQQELRQTQANPLGPAEVLEALEQNSLSPFGSGLHPHTFGAHNVFHSHASSMKNPHASGDHNRFHSHTSSTKNSQKRPHALAFSNSVSFPPSVSVKQEGAVFDESRQPKNVIEMNLMAQLQQMGFADRREILSTIRRLIETNPEHPPTPDAVMIDIVTQREEAEEARKMDEARLQSEQARKEDARKRRKELEEQFEQRLRAADLQVWSSEVEMFPDSWILSSPARTVLAPMVAQAESLKFKLLELLKLEKKARKWYGVALPYGYFGFELADRLVERTTVNAMTTQIQEEVAKLESGMYNLSGMYNTGFHHCNDEKC